MSTESNVQKSIVKRTKSQGKNTPGAKALTVLVAKIRTDVQHFADSMSNLTRDTDKLAPMVAAAFAEYQKAFPEGTKLGFMKYFATEEQAKSWPETDLQAKAPGNPVQGLFNSIEYLLRRAVQLQRQAEFDAKVEAARAEAEKRAIAEAKAKGLRGQEADLYVNRAKEEATANLIPPTSGGRPSQEGVIALIEEGWNSDLDNWETFMQFISRLLAVKYSEKTVANIMDRVSVDIAGQQQEEVATVVAQNPTAPAPTVETTVVPAPAALPFSHRGSRRRATAGAAA